MRQVCANVPRAGGLGAASRYTQSIAVRIYQGALTPGEPFVIDEDTELGGYDIDALDVEMDQRVRPGVAFVLREVEPNAPACHGNEPGKVGLELMLPLLLETEPLVPGTARPASSTWRTGTTSSSMVIR